ncbi:MAG TPA: TlyA family RNA methyltransferase [Burkholderiaceae bacterium]|nr:TlyA family RNA methyltransferase [Burkholderiaceae bacterium]
MGRVDVELVARGLAPSRSAAQRLIADGAVRDGHGAPVLRASQQVSGFDELRVEPSDETRYASRAGAKLAHALAASGVDPRGAVALDLGMSTGGFADCLLQAGAARIVGIEVGHGQLHPRLRADPRVACLEHLNVREVTPQVLAARLSEPPPADGFDLLVADLSFVSLTKVLAAVDPLLAPGAIALLLVKPQFELSPGELDGRGVVVSPADRARAVESVTTACLALGWTVHGVHDSALAGGDGNRETFLHASRPGARALPSRTER